MSAASSRSMRSRCAPASPAISRACISTTARSSSRATCCSPSTSGRSRTRSTRRAPISRRREVESAPTPKPIWRAASSWCATRPSPSRSSSSARRRNRNAAGVGRGATRRRCARPSSICEFTELRAPVTGRIGDRRVSPGNLVTGGTGGNTTLLATIVSLDPIRFEFTFDEASLPALRAAVASTGQRGDRPRRQRHRSRSS